MTHPIPDAALDDRFAIVGTSGSGKTYLATGAIERLLARKSRFIGFDPLGVMWGLRLMADGKTPSPFNVVIFGGQHGDLPISENAGAIIGQAIAQSPESCIVDLSELGSFAAERRFMFALLTALWRHTNKLPVHLIFDEADQYAPQSIRDKEGGVSFKLLGMMENIVRRGRTRGFISWLISQRPAVVNKNVLSQADALVAMKLTSSQDRDQLGDWVSGQADAGQWKSIYGELPTYGRGEGLLWIPGRGIFHRASFPAKKTFDSSAAPQRGKKHHAAALTPIDLGALKGKLATVEAETKANDPRALQGEIARLKRELAAKPVATAPAVNPAVLAKQLAAAFKAGRDAAVEEGEKQLRDMEGHFRARVTDMRNNMRAVRPPETQTETPSTGFPKSIAQVNAIPVRATKPAKIIPENITDAPLRAERKPLAALASVYPGGMTEAQWAVAAGLKRRGGTWGTYISRLRVAGRIRREGDVFFATETGVADVGDVPALPPPGPALVEFWASKIPAAGPMLRAIAAVWPDEITRDDLAERLGLAASGGTFGTYLSRLRTPGLIETDGEAVRASDSLMLGA